MLQPTLRQGTETVPKEKDLSNPTVTTHAPSGDGNPLTPNGKYRNLRYNPRSVRGRKLLPPARLAIYARLQPTPRQGTETKTAYAPLPAQAGYNPRPVRGRKSIENLGTIWSKVTTHAPSGDGNFIAK